MEKVLRRVKGELGYPVVTIEVKDEDIKDIIRDSVEFINEYSNSLNAITVPIDSGNSIDLSQYPEIYKVVKVMEDKTSTSGEGYRSEMMLMGSLAFGRSVRTGYSSGCPYGHTVDSSQLIMLNKAREKFLNSMAREINFSVLGSRVYIPNRTGTVTLIYIPRLDPESISSNDPVIVDYVIRYASATLKKLVGKARKRYTSSKALFEHDTDVYSEGEQEMDKLMEELKGSSLILAESI